MSRNKHTEKGIKDNFGEHLRAFFDWMLVERNMSPHTIHAYRDVVTLFLHRLCETTGQRIENLKIDVRLHDQVLDFLQFMEKERGASIVTRNHRLSALKSFFRFVVYKEPLLIGCCRRATLIPLKKHETKLLGYLEPEQMETILVGVDRSTRSGRRDYAVLLLLYNSGCRASEIEGMKRNDLHLEEPAHVEILGKGRKRRILPIWKRTITAIKETLSDRRDDNPSVFLGQRKQALTRAGVGYLVRKYADWTVDSANGRVTPHTIRHTTAVAILRATGDIDATARILGHASLDTTKVYIDRDQSRLRSTLERVSASTLGTRGDEWKSTNDLLDWLESL